jgi:hypothetical protein
MKPMGRRMTISVGRPSELKRTRISVEEGAHSGPDTAARCRANGAMQFCVV